MRSAVNTLLNEMWSEQSMLNVSKLGEFYAWGHLGGE